MNRAVIGASLFLGLSAGCKGVIAPENSKPNIVFILADDMGYGDIQALNNDSKAPTPNLDNLVNEGVNFTDAHTNSAVCTPTRYGILTGRYCFRSRLKKGVLTGYQPSLIEENRTTVASLLKTADYKTACIGKWHLGLDWEKKKQNIPLVTGGGKYAPACTENVNFDGSVKGGPSDHGFDYEYILPASLDMPPYVFVENQKVVNKPSAKVDAKRDTICRGVLYRKGDIASDFKHENVLQQIVTKAKNYIVSNSKKEQPFFLYLPLTAPHTPWLPSKAFRNKSQAGVYGDFVCMVDDMVGQIESTLKKAGITENTILVFTSDNGSHWMKSDIERFQHLANADRRGMKSDLYEGGHRVPFIVKWPQRIKAKANCDEVICTTDFMATCAEIVGYDLDSNEGEDSRSFLSYLIEPAKELSQRAIIHHSVDGSFAIRQGDWKYLDCKGSGGWTYPNKIANKKEDKNQLYKIKEDHFESLNQIDAYPAKADSLKALLHKYINQGHSKN